jgi:hypothetical protein
VYRLASHIMVMSLRSKWAAGWGSVSAGRRIGVWGGKTASRHGYNDQEVSTELMTLCKRRHTDTPIRFPVKWPTPSGRSAINLAICPRFRSAEYWRMSEIFRIC